MLAFSLFLCDDGRVNIELRISAPECCFFNEANSFIVPIFELKHQLFGKDISRLGHSIVALRRYKELLKIDIMNCFLRVKSLCTILQKLQAVLTGTNFPALSIFVSERALATRRISPYEGHLQINQVDGNWRKNSKDFRWTLTTLRSES